MTSGETPRLRTHCPLTTVVEIGYFSRTHPIRVDWSARPRRVVGPVCRAGGAGWAVPQSTVTEHLKAQWRYRSGIQSTEYPITRTQEHHIQPDRPLLDSRLLQYI